MTIQIEKVSRTMTREHWDNFWRIIRKAGEKPPIHDALRGRETLERELAKAVDRDGLICVISSGMDCDCVQFTHSSVVEYRGVIWFERYEQNEYAWADGPLSVGFCKPEDQPENYSRDLALEAFEEGRPHLITTARNW